MIGDTKIMTGIIGRTERTSGGVGTTTGGVIGTGIMKEGREKDGVVERIVRLGYHLRNNSRTKAKS